MAKIVTITNPLTGQPAQVDQLDHTAQQIDDGLNIARGVSNTNLLDNWYFGRPVNQRGQTSYSAEWGYTIDRWQISIDSSLTVNNGSISLTGGYVFEPLEEIADALKGKTVTVSLLFATGELEFATGVVPTTWAEWDVIASNNHVVLHGIGEGSKRLWFLIRDSAKNILAAKLELGSQQTLAHQDTNGNWVLNEIPDYGEQLRRCQRYSVHSVGQRCSGYAINGSDSATIFIPTPVTMRTIASAEIVTTDNLVTSYGDIIPIKSFSLAATLPNGVIGNLQINSPVTQNCVVAAAGFKCNLIADL